MPDIKTGHEITPTKPEVDTFVPTDALERILAESTKTLEEMQIEFEFLWSLTDGMSTMRPTPEGLEEREFKLRKMLAYVAFLQVTLEARKAEEAAKKVADDEQKAEDDLLAVIDQDEDDEEDGV